MPTRETWNEPPDGWELSGVQWRAPKARPPMFSRGQSSRSESTTLNARETEGRYELRGAISTRARPPCEGPPTEALRLWGALNCARTIAATTSVAPMGAQGARP